MLVVLHVCCGVCAAGAAQQLFAEGHELRGYFYNPNIYPAEEHARRLGAAQTVARELGFPLEAGPYNPEEWQEATRSLASEPEGGKSCPVCFRLRLRQTFLDMLEKGGDAFTTTLTVGPRKRADVVNAIGMEVGGDRFLARDFKKKDGFRHATELARRLALYRQAYCGCIYSMRQG